MGTCGYTDYFLEPSNHVWDLPSLRSFYVGQEDSARFISGPLSDRPSYIAFPSLLIPEAIANMREIGMQIKFGRESCEVWLP